MTYSTVDLERYAEDITRNEELLFGDQGFDAEDIAHFDRHPRYNTGMILDKNNDLAAYAFMKSVKPGVVRILRLCVLPEHRGQGYGRSLHDALLLGGFHYRVRVPERWLESQLWLKRQGWIAVGIAPDGYEFRKFVESSFEVS